MASERRQTTLAKYARIQKLQQTGINNTRLWQVILKVKEDPEIVQEVKSKYTLQKSLAAVADRLGDERKVQLNLEKPFRRSNVFQWQISSIPKCLRSFAQTSSGFLQMLQATYKRKQCTPGSPWSLILNFDEIIPGQILRQDNRRKTWCWYVSFLEFGSEYLAHEAAWVPLGALRTFIIQQAVGKFSAVAAALLQHMFIDSPYCSEGILLDHIDDGSPAYVFVKFHNPLADEAGLKYFWSLKGAAGLIPCFECTNIALREADPANNLLAHDTTGTLRDIRCPNVAEFKCLEMEDRFTQADVLTGLTHLPAEDFEKVQRSYGLKYNPTGVLWNPSLRPILAECRNRYDGMHCILQEGIALKEINFLLLRLSKLPQPILMPQIRLICSTDWRAPGEFKKSNHNWKGFSAPLEKGIGKRMNTSAVERAKFFL